MEEERGVVFIFFVSSHGNKAITTDWHFGFVLCMKSRDGQRSDNEAGV